LDFIEFWLHIKKNDRWKKNVFFKLSESTRLTDQSVINQVELKFLELSNKW